MHITSTQGPAPLTLTDALLIYRNKEQQVLMRGRVGLRDGQAQILNTEPVTDNLIHSMLDMARQRDLHYLSEHVLAVTSQACAWFIPAQDRSLLFLTDRDVALRDLNGQSFPQPPLVMISTRRQLQVFALQDNRRPTPGTQLMNAPFYNIFDDHRVCMGNTPLPKNAETPDTGEWEAAFYNSFFTHRAGSKVRWAREMTHKELWEHAQARGAFDPTWLQESGLTLDGALCGR